MPVATFTFQLRQRDADWQEHLLEGTATGSTFTDALHDALKQGYLALTGGDTTYGKPRTQSCRGPYTILELHIIKTEPLARPKEDLSRVF